MDELTCGECGARLTGTDMTCRMMLDSVMAWDGGDRIQMGNTHLLTVLCYNLQHPSLYSREGLKYATGVLMDTVAKELVTDADKAARTPVTITALTIGASAHNTAAYTSPVVWTRTVADIVAAGPSGYSDRVRAWGVSIFTALKESGNL